MHPLDSLAGTNLDEQRRSREAELRERQLARVAETARAVPPPAPKHPTVGVSATPDCPTPPCGDGSPSAQPA